MRLLLDTHAALWWFNDDPRLSKAARRAIAHPESVRFLSIAAAWEMALKSALKKLVLPRPVQAFLKEHLVANQIELLPIGLPDLARVESLPFHHRDPFDRIMAAQAIEEGLSIVSSDRVFKQYGIRRVW